MMGFFRKKKKNNVTRDEMLNYLKENGYKYEIKNVLDDEFIYLYPPNELDGVRKVWMDLHYSNMVDEWSVCYHVMYDELTLEDLDYCI